MGIFRSVGVVVLVVLLTINLTAANVAVGVDRTVLDPGFVTSTLASEDAYESLTSVTMDQLAGMNESSNGSFDRFPVAPEDILARSVTPAYLRGQTEANVERNLAYLHGERDEPRIAVDLRPVKENVTAAIVTELQDVTVAELLGMFSPGTDTTSAPDQLSLSLLIQMSESEHQYQEARQEFRSAVREQVVDTLVDEALAEATNDELLALVIDGYDPDAYSEAEKASMVDDRTAEIRDALRSSIEANEGDAIDEQIAANLTAYREEIRSEVLTQIEGSSDQLGPGASSALSDLVGVGLDGLTTDMSYAEFRTELEAAKDELAVALGDRLSQTLDESVPDQFDLTAQMDQSALDGLAQARKAVQIVDLLAVALPVAAVVLVGLLWLLSRSLVTTLLGPGVASLVAGGTGFAGAKLAPDLLRARIPADAAGDQGLQAGIDLALAIVDRVFGAFAFQSGLLLGLGVVLVGLALAFKTGYLTAGTITGLVGRE